MIRLPGYKNTVRLQMQEEDGSLGYFRFASCAPFLYEAGLMVMECKYLPGLGTTP